MLKVLVPRVAPAGTVQGKRFHLLENIWPPVHPPSPFFQLRLYLNCKDPTACGHPACTSNPISSPVTPHIWSPFKLLEKAPDCLHKIPDSPQETACKWRGQALVLMDSPLKTCLQGKQRKAHWRLFAIGVSTHMLEMHHLPSDLLNWNPGGGYQHCLVFCLLVCLFGLLSSLVFTLFFKILFSIENTGFQHGVFIHVSSYLAINRFPPPLPSLYHPSSWIPFCLYLSCLLLTCGVVTPLFPLQVFFHPHDSCSTFVSYKHTWMYIHICTFCYVFLLTCLFVCHSGAGLFCFT